MLQTKTVMGGHCRWWLDIDGSVSVVPYIHQSKTVIHIDHMPVTDIHIYGVCVFFSLHHSTV